ncbi:MAG: hypothetical protein JW836_12110 [Deltaproteobacteria bacterium]|nr:hypothetical protein [Deltaproteobacteria bacterium]
MNKPFGVVLVLAGLLLTVYGCASKGYIRTRMVHPDQISVQSLLETWQDYTIHFTGHGRGHPSAVLFKPKSDGKVVIADRWWKVEQYEILADLVDSIQRQLPIAYYYPRLLQLMGPDNHRYGYVFTSWDHVVAKLVDERTIIIYDLPLPPYLAIDGGDAPHGMEPQ